LLYYADNAVRGGVGTCLAQDTDNGLPETVKDAEGNLTTTVYDGHDRKSKVFYPDKTVANRSSGTDFEQCYYDANGNAVILRKRDGQLVIRIWGYLTLNVYKHCFMEPLPL
jgi:YD repeat-containing protein